MSGKTPSKSGGGTRPKQIAGHGSTSRPARGGSQALVPRSNRSIAMKQEGGVIVPEGYSVRKIEPAKNYDVVSFARAMNPDFAPRLKKLFDPETEAAIEAQKTGIYIGWRCPEFKHDCQRVNRKSKCFCGHLLEEHAQYSAKSVMVPCKQAPCKCKGYAWCPSRPEDVGEFWHQRRREFDPSTWRAKCRCKHTHEEHDPTGLRRCKNRGYAWCPSRPEDVGEFWHQRRREFDPSTWRAKCRCKHTHEEHDPTGLRRCKNRGCSCGHFDSNFLCAACDQHWEKHETFFESEEERVQKGLPVGEMYLPFAEMPDLRNIALTGREDDDMPYKALTQGEGSIPRSSRPVGNNAPVNFGAGGNKHGFRPVYD